MTSTIPPVLTTAEVASIWGVDRSTILHAIDDGRLPARQGGRIWLVERDDVIAWRGTPERPRLTGKPGRPLQP